MPFARTVIQTDHASIFAAPGMPRFITALLVTASAVLCTSTALAADGSDLSNPEARYQKERAACISGQSHQDRATCLKEAGAARDEAKRGQLKDGQAPYEQNALARCTALPPDDRQACERRIKGAGIAKGSVTEGGIYRETREIIISEPAAPDSTAR
jgi:hypothetical protein